MYNKVRIRIMENIREQKTVICSTERDNGPLQAPLAKKLSNSIVFLRSLPHRAK